MILPKLRGAVAGLGLAALPLAVLPLVALPLGAAAQEPVAGAPATAGPPEAMPADPTLADMRATLDQLAADLQSLRAELRAGGAPAFKAAGGDSAIDRMNGIEVEIARLNAVTEKLGNRINRIVADGTNRLGDVEFRLCELTEDCDLGALTTAQPLGGLPLVGLEPEVAAAGGEVSRNADAAPGGAATAQERAEFDRAAETLRSGDAAEAAEQFAAFAATHAGGPLAIEATWLRGTALAVAGDAGGAAEAWLAVFSSDPNGARSADALLGLGRLAADAGRTEQACNFLGEVAARFAGTPSAQDAETRRADLACQTATATSGLGATEAGATDPEAAADAELDAELDAGLGPDPAAASADADGG